MTTQNPELGSRPWLDRATVLLATGFGISLLPGKILERWNANGDCQRLVEKKWTGAGLLGTIEAAILYLFLPSMAYRYFLLVVLAFIFFSVVISTQAEKILGGHDDARIVIDEWAGVWVALWGTMPRLGLSFFLAVIFFRIFDVLKGPIGRRLQYLPGGWGVVMDDVFAGLAANILVRVVNAVI